MRKISDMGIVLTIWSLSFTPFFLNSAFSATLSYCQQIAAKNNKSASEKKDRFMGISAPHPTAWQGIKRVFIVVLENTDAKLAAEQPFLKSLIKEGALLAESHGVTHPSQPNYIAMVSGGLHNVTSNDNYNLKAHHIGDLLEKQGKKWKLYAENFPGNCFLPATATGNYVRKHVPFLSFKNVTRSKERCSNIVPASQLDIDIQKKSLPELSLFVPNNMNNGHDTSVTHADQWLNQKFSKLLKTPDFIDNTLFVVTFDESLSETNHISTILYGAGVKVGSISHRCYDHYSLLATIENIFKAGNLGKNDLSASIIDDVWKNP